MTRSRPAGTAPPRPGIAWITANTIAYAAALTAWISVSGPLWPALSPFLGGSATLALQGAVLGAGASLLQLAVLKVRLPRAWAWIGSTATGWALGFVAASWAALAVTHSFPPDANKYLSNTAVETTFGIVAGLGIGTGRWLALRRDSPAARRWIPVAAVGFTVGYGCATAVAQLTYPLPAPTVAAIFGTCAGIVQATIEWAWFGHRGEAWPAGRGAAPPG